MVEENSLKQFRLNGGQFPHQMRPRSSSRGVSQELIRKHQEGGGDSSVDNVIGKKGTHQSIPVTAVESDQPIIQSGARRMSSGSLPVSQHSTASSIGSCNATAIRKMEETGELKHQGDDSGLGKLLLGFHYNRDGETLTLKVIQAKELRTVHEGEICSFVTVSFLPYSSSVRLETKVRLLTSNPVWKEVFRICHFQEDNFREHKAFVFEIWDKLSNGYSQRIGEAVVLLRNMTLSELEKGIVLWKYLALDRQESELSLGELTFHVWKSNRKKQLTVKIDRVTNAAIPPSATSPRLYMKLELHRGETEVLSDRTKAVSNSYSPVFKHKTRICLMTNDLREMSLNLLLRQENSARENHLHHDSLPSAHHLFQKTVGTVHLSQFADRKELREAWQKILNCKDKRLHFRLKFSAPPMIEDED